MTTPNPRMESALSAFALAGKVALVSGAASGLGLATARLFLEVGASVVLADLDGEAAAGAAAELEALGPVLRTFHHRLHGRRGIDPDADPRMLERALCGVLPDDDPRARRTRQPGHEMQSLLVGETIERNHQREAETPNHRERADDSEAPN